LILRLQAERVLLLRVPLLAKVLLQREPRHSLRSFLRRRKRRTSAYYLSPSSMLTTRSENSCSTLRVIV
jgi:hypothetical protein